MPITSDKEFVVQMVLGTIKMPEITDAARAQDNPAILNMIFRYALDNMRNIPYTKYDSIMALLYNNAHTPLAIRNFLYKNYNMQRVYGDQR